MRLETEDYGREQFYTAQRWSLIPSSTNPHAILYSTHYSVQHHRLKDHSINSTLCLAESHMYLCSFRKSSYLTAGLAEIIEIECRVRADRASNRRGRPLLAMFGELHYFCAWDLQALILTPHPVIARHPDPVPPASTNHPL